MISIPMAASCTAGSVKSPMPSRDAVTRPELAKPRRARNRPMAAPTPTFRFLGITRTISSRTLNRESSRKIKPEMTMSVRACCQVAPPAATRPAKMALVPMPGPSAKGRLAYRAISRVIRPLIRAVEIITPVTFMPVPDIRLACTIRIYAMVAKVVTPPMISRRIVEPRSEILKRASSLFIGITPSL